MKFKANFLYKPSNFQMFDCQIEKVVELSREEFRKLRIAPKAQGVHCVGGPYQMTVAAAPEVSAQNEPPQAEEQAPLLIGLAMG